METTACHDCGKSISFSARTCPHCGSTEQFGPYQFSAREARLHRIEDRNDRRLAVSAMTFGALGAAYGFATSTSAVGAFFAVAAYGLLGLIIGVPVGFAINFMRSM